MNDDTHATLGTLPGVLGVIEAWVILVLLVIMLGLAVWTVGYLMLGASPGAVKGRYEEDRDELDQRLADSHG